MQMMDELLTRSCPWQADLLHLLLDSIEGLAVFVIDENGTVHAWNTASERMLGYSEEEILGRSSFVTFTAEDRERGIPESEIQTALCEGRVTGERSHLRKDGTKIRVSTNMVLFRDEAGQVRGLAKVLRDLTGSKQDADALAESEARLRAAIAAADMGTWLWRIKSNEHILDDSLRRLLGLQPGEDVQTLEDFLRAVHPDDRQRVRSAFEQCVNRGGDLIVEFRVAWPDQRIRWIRNRGKTFLDSSGRPMFTTGACVDITDRRVAEDEREQVRDQLEQQVEERTVLLGAAIEELNQEAAERRQAQEARRMLLGQLVSAQDDDRRRIAAELHDRLGQYLAAMNLTLSMLKESLGDDSPAGHQLQQLSQITSEIGKEVHHTAVEIRPKALDDLGLRRAIENYVDSWAERTQIAAQFTSQGLDGERFPWQISTAVFRVVQEALTNVLRHAEARRVSVIIERRPEMLSAIIEDNGRGFDPDELMESPRTTGGLGLLGMRERIALVHGTLQIESSPGAGTTIFARIPLQFPEKFDG